MADVQLPWVRAGLYIPLTEPQNLIDPTSITLGFADFLFLEMFLLLGGRGRTVTRVGLEACDLSFSVSTFLIPAKNVSCFQNMLSNNVLGLFWFLH